MRKSIIIAAIAASFALIAGAYANDRSGLSDRDTTGIHRKVSDDSRGERHDRFERKDRMRERHDESHQQSHEQHDESRERNDRR